MYVEGDGRERAVSKRKKNEGVQGYTPEETEANTGAMIQFRGLRVGG